MTPLKLLAWIGDRAPGALAFKPALQFEQSENWLEKISAERLAREARDILRGQPGEIAAIATAGGSAGGAHPKALVIEHDDGSLSLARSPASTTEFLALLKLGLPEQPSLRTEYAYLLMARAAGVDVTPFRLVGDGERPHLLVKRFDWRAGRPLHLHSLSGLWHRPKAGLDYSDLFRAAVRLGLGKATVVQIARRMLFNLFSVNHDDHGRNHAFLYDVKGRQWELSPAFDLTYAPGILSRGLTIAGEVSPSPEVVFAFLESVALSRPEVNGLIAEVRAAVARWAEFADDAGVPSGQVAEIAAAHRQAVGSFG